MFRILIIFLCHISGSLCVDCRSGWTQMGTNCYFYIERRMTYAEANIECKSLGSELVSIKNYFQNEMITNLIYSTWAKDDNVWLGARKLTRTENYSQWIWRDFTEVNYFNWAPNQPNSNGPQNCLQMVRRHKVHYNWPAGTWNDIDCKEKSAVLCQLNNEEPDSFQSNNNPEKPENLRNSDKEPDQINSYNIGLIILAILICSVIISIFVSCFTFIILNRYLKLYPQLMSPRSHFGIQLIGEKHSFSSDNTDV